MLTICRGSSIPLRSVNCETCISLNYHAFFYRRQRGYTSQIGLEHGSPGNSNLVRPCNRTFEAIRIVGTTSNCRDHAESGLVSTRIQTNSPPAMPNSVKKRDMASGRTQARRHTVCAVMTSAFLDFSKSRSNDLSTSVPEYGFPDLKPGDRRCLCAAGWQEALKANQAPRVVLRATRESGCSRDVGIWIWHQYRAARRSLSNW